MRYTVASVPYINAIPLTDALEHWPDRIHVLYDVPSKLPALLETGEADAVLVSSIDALREPGRRMAMGVCIGSDGPVKSVRLFSKVPPAEIRRLAFDASSMTSNRLAQIILRDVYGTVPDVIVRAPNLKSMLAEADACVLIGDIGMRTEGSGLFILDLGEEWTELTQLPFLWAAWIGGERVTPELAQILLDARVLSGLGKPDNQDEVSARALAETVSDDQTYAEKLIEKAVQKSDLAIEVVRDYYRDVMVYDMTSRMVAGYREFQRRLVSFGHIDCCHYPHLVDPSGK